MSDDYVAIGQLTNFRKGWAIVPFYERPHYWQRRDLTRVYVSACGITNDLTAAHPGVLPINASAIPSHWCKRCGNRRM